MSVDLADLTDSLKREVNPPGTDLFPNATDDEYAGYLADAFWRCRLDGMLAAWTANDTIVTPAVVGGVDITRDLQQLVILYAGIRIVLNQLRNIQTVFRAQAGPVEFETQQSAQVLKGLLDELQKEKNLVLIRLSDVGQVPSYVIDAVIARDEALQYGFGFFIN